MSFPLELIFPLPKEDTRKVISQSEYDTYKLWAKEDYKYGRLNYRDFSRRLIEIDNKYRVEVSSGLQQ